MGFLDELFGSDDGSEKAAELGEKTLAYQKEMTIADQARRDAIIAGLQPQVDYANATDKAAADAALADAATARTRGNTMWDTYMNSVMPVQQKFYQEALDYGGAADQERAAGMATSDVRQQYGIQKGINDRNLASMGVNPNSGRFASADRAAELSAMAAAAGGATKARTTARDTGIQLRKDATQIGQNLATGTQDFNKVSLAGGTLAGGLTNQAVNRGLAIGNYKVGGTANAMNAVNQAAGNTMTAYGNQDTSGILPTLAGVGTAYALNKFKP
jgi:hypothetical protein